MITTQPGNYRCMEQHKQRPLIWTITCMSRGLRARTPKSAWTWPAPPPWYYSSEAWLRWGWKCPRMALCWFSLVLEPSVAVKQSAIEFAHSGRTLNRKEGSSHSFWSYCLTTRLKQSNSSVAIAGCLQACHGFFFFSFTPGGHWGRGAGMDRNWLFMVFTYFWWFDDIFSWLTLRYPFSNSKVCKESGWVYVLEVE